MIFKCDIYLGIGFLILLRILLKINNNLGILRFSQDKTKRSFNSENVFLSTKNIPVFEKNQKFIALRINNVLLINTFFFKCRIGVFTISISIHKIFFKNNENTVEIVKSTLKLSVIKCMIVFVRSYKSEYYKL